MELVVATNPDPDSRLPYLLHVPVGDGLVFATKGTWPRTAGLYCHPLPADAWPPPDEVDVVERVPLRACTRRGAAIDVVADRGRESRSQIVFTHARGRQMVFWQSPRTRKQARPDVRTPTARAAGIAELEVVVDAHERYAWSFADQPAVRTVRRGLACGDYAVTAGGRVVAAVERKTMTDLVGSLTSGRLRYALGELSALPRAALVVEESYAKVFAQDHVRPAVVADGLAEVQVAFPGVPVVFCDTRKIAQEWTYRWLAAALSFVEQEGLAATTTGVADAVPVPGAAPEPSTREVRAWALAQGMAVSDRGRLRPDVVAAWRAAHGGGS
ncbi:ERCC4 domain-containing protein [Pseudokineococcus basanitobsidens]|uniref:ERCC4 domain-containing protein n=1 Tax=Pseudokineococcus basanitobsidens TaxID=1926649 RepID=UPI003BB593FD